jgi:hypothetical protein
LFSFIYEAFSHEVYSIFMIGLAFVPLVFGLLPFLALKLTQLPFPHRVALNTYNSGVAALTIGCCLRGIFDIYGSTCSLLIVYWIAGAALIFCGILTYIFTHISSNRSS